jgi:quercetin dioxygenase-like cupin family protein
MADGPASDAVVNLLQPTGVGPLWGLASSDLNATLLVWTAGHELAEHTNTERDVLLIVFEGSAVATVEGDEHHLAVGSALLIDKGKSRSFRAGDDGIRYLSVHTRRGPLQIER